MKLPLSAPSISGTDLASSLPLSVPLPISESDLASLFLRWPNHSATRQRYRWLDPPARCRLHCHPLLKLILCGRRLHRFRKPVRRRCRCLSWNRIPAAVVSAGSENRHVDAVVILCSSADQFIVASNSHANRFVVAAPTVTPDRFPGASTSTASRFVVASNGMSGRFVGSMVASNGISSRDDLVVADRVLWLASS